MGGYKPTTTARCKVAYTYSRESFRTAIYNSKYIYYYTIYSKY